MVIKTVQKKGGIKSLQNDTENIEFQKNDVYLKKSLLPAIVGLIIMIVVVIFVVAPVLAVMEQEVQDSLIAKRIVEFFPALFGFILLMLFVFALNYGLNNKTVDENEEAYYIDTADIAIAPGTLKVRDAKKILQIRFAKGEISSEEYTERMARL